MADVPFAAVVFYPLSLLPFGLVALIWQLGIFAAKTLLLVFVVIQLRVGRRRQRLAKETQESLSEMTAITEEALSVSGIC